MPYAASEKERKEKVSVCKQNETYFFSNLGEYTTSSKRRKVLKTVSNFEREITFLDME